MTRSTWLLPAVVLRQIVADASVSSRASTLRHQTDRGTYPGEEVHADVIALIPVTRTASYNPSVLCVSSECSVSPVVF